MTAYGATREGSNLTSTTVCTSTRENVNSSAARPHKRQNKQNSSHLHSSALDRPDAPHAVGDGGSQHPAVGVNRADITVIETENYQYVSLLRLFTLKA